MGATDRAEATAQAKDKPETPWADVVAQQFEQIDTQARSKYSTVADYTNMFVKDMLGPIAVGAATVALTRGRGWIIPAVGTGILLHENQMASERNNKIADEKIALIQQKFGISPEIAQANKQGSKYYESVAATLQTPLGLAEKTMPVLFTAMGSTAIGFGLLENNYLARLTNVAKLEATNGPILKNPVIAASALGGIAYGAYRFNDTSVNFDKTNRINAMRQYIENNPESFKKKVSK